MTPATPRVRTEVTLSKGESASCECACGAGPLAVARATALCALKVGSACWCRPHRPSRWGPRLRSTPADPFPRQVSGREAASGDGSCGDSAWPGRPPSCYCLAPTAACQEISGVLGECLCFHFILFGSYRCKNRNGVLRMILYKKNPWFTSFLPSCIHVNLKVCFVLLGEIIILEK